MHKRCLCSFVKEWFWKQGVETGVITMTLHVVVLYVMFDHGSDSLICGICRLDEVGALRRAFLSENHKTWRLFTFPCLHAGFIHLLINLCSVVFIGIHLEQEFGPCRFSFPFSFMDVVLLITKRLFLNSPFSHSYCEFVVVGQ